MATADLLHRCSSIRDTLIQAGLFAPIVAAPSPALPSQESVNTSWRIGLEPLPLSQEQLTFFHSLGPQLLRFYRSVNRLYAESVRGAQPAWVAAYLDQGKPEGLIAYSRMKRFRDHVPAVIRPDVIPTLDGMVITELDSVPGGIGMIAVMSRAYADLSSHDSPQLIGGRDGMVDGFAAMLRGHRYGRRDSLRFRDRTDAARRARGRGDARARRSAHRARKKRRTTDRK